MNSSGDETYEQTAAEVRAAATPLLTPDDLDPLMERIGSARVVLLGEASHGTADYYLWRAAITRRLIAEQGFSFVAVEGDWPDCFRVNRWVKNRADRDLTAVDVLGRYDRWPRWMWANEEVAAFLSWLREHNASGGADVGFYGLDVYSLWESMDAVIDYLSHSDPEALDAAKAAYSCFEPFGEDPHRYARAQAVPLVPASCEREVVALLADLRRGAVVGGDVPDEDPEAGLDARQNAEVLVGAESYYRAMIGADAKSWNIRDRHMTDTLDRLLAHYAARGADAKAIVWAHNTHVGDARATPMARRGMVNVGHLARERYGAHDVVAVGFAGHGGSVIAAEAWGSAAERLPVPAAPDGSYEQLLHRVLGEPSLLVFPEESGASWLSRRCGHRAIGVVYHPEADRYANWVPTEMGRRYDALLSFDTTEALHPLHRESRHPGAEQEAWPTGG